MKNKPISYTTKQLVFTLRDNDNSIRAIADALGLSVGVVHKILQTDDIEQLPEIVGDGCYYTSTKTGEQQPTDPQEEDNIQEGLSLIANSRQLNRCTHLDSGYKDIYYNERSSQWEVWMKGKRIWRTSCIADAAKVRLAKNNLLDTDREVLEAIATADNELLDILNNPI